MRCPICRSTYQGPECPDCSPEQPEPEPGVHAIALAMFRAATRYEPLEPALREQAEKLGLISPRLPDTWRATLSYDDDELWLYGRWLVFTGQVEAARQFVVVCHAANLSVSRELACLGGQDGC